MVAHRRGRSTGSVDQAGEAPTGYEHAQCQQEPCPGPEDPALLVIGFDSAVIHEEGISIACRESDAQRQHHLGKQVVEVEDIRHCGVTMPTVARWPYPTGNVYSVQGIQWRPGLAVDITNGPRRGISRFPG